MARAIEIGDTFEDRDNRAGDRVVKVIEGEERPGKVRVTTTVNTFKPNAIGRRYYIKREILEERFTRISH